MKTVAKENIVRLWESGPQTWRNCTNKSDLHWSFVQICPKNKLLNVFLITSRIAKTDYQRRSAWIRYWLPITKICVIEIKSVGPVSVILIILRNNRLFLDNVQKNSENLIYITYFFRSTTWVSQISVSTFQLNWQVMVHCFNPCKKTWSSVIETL